MAAKPIGASFETTIVRVFKAPATLLFDCFTDPAHLAGWWGPLGSKIEVYKLEARPGGELSLRMAGPGFDHVMGGEYVELDRPHGLVFLTKAFEAPDGGWGIINRNSFNFEEQGDGTTKATLHVHVDRAEGELVLGALGGMRAGWGQSLERLGDHLGGGGKMDIEIGDKRLVLTRAFDAQPKRVWQALTDPAQFAQWFCAGAGKVQAWDLRPGGQWA